MQIHKWFQNLNDNKKRLFFFRGSWSVSRQKNGREKYTTLFKYELCSGPALKLKVETGGESAVMLILGLGFFTAYLSFPFLGYGYKETTTGFYLFDWSLVWSFMRHPHESSSRDPWYKSFYFRIDDFFLGRREVLEHSIMNGEDLFFTLGGKEFKINSVEFKKRRNFRRHIPYSLFHSSWISVDIKCENPPMRSGKGENSWDCGDDGCYGLSGGWDKSEPSWMKPNEHLKLAVDYYVGHVMKDAKRYGSGSGDRGINYKDEYVYIGRKPRPEDANCASVEGSPI